MSLKSVIIVEVEKGDNKYVLHMPAGVPLHECYDASVEITKEIVDFSRKMEEQQQEKKEAVVTEKEIIEEEKDELINKV